MRVTEQLQASDPSGRGEEPGRSSAFELPGVVALAGLAVVATGLVRAAAVPPGRVTVLVLATGLAMMAFGAGLAARRARQEGLPLTELPQLLARPWLRPRRPAFMFVFGVLLALPVAALHSKVVTGVDADSANLTMMIGVVQREGLSFLVDTQANFLPFILLGPFVAVGGIGGAMLFSILSVQFLAGTMAYVTWSFSRSWLAAAAAVLGSLAFQGILERATRLPMYAPMLAFGILGVYLAYRAVQSEGRRRWIAAGLAGLCLNLSIESQTVGQLLVPMPFLLVLTTRPRAAIQGLVRVYAAFALFYIPRAVVNLMEGGFSHFLGNRVDFWITKGYLSTIQHEFFGYPSRLPLPGYLREFGGDALTIVNGLVLFVVVLAILSLVLSSGRLRWAGLLAVAFVVGAIVYQRAPAFSRYLSPLMIAAALGAGGGVTVLGRLRARWWRVGAIASVVVLVFGVASNLVSNARYVRIKEGELLSGPLPRLARIADDGRGLIGARSSHLGFVDADIPRYAGSVLSEREYVTFLTWPSDQDVIGVLRGRDIGWVLINPDQSLELAYNDTWLLPAYGTIARHVSRIEASPGFCRAGALEGYLLYRLGPCPA
ncbi:MAG TPA: hypothetical protein VGA70_09210 [Longimicrobiales bacterium]